MSGEIAPLVFSSLFLSLSLSLSFVAAEETEKRRKMKESKDIFSDFSLHHFSLFRALTGGASTPLSRFSLFARRTQSTASASLWKCTAVSYTLLAALFPIRARKFTRRKSIESIPSENVFSPPLPRPRPCGEAVFAGLQRTHGQRRAGSTSRWPRSPTRARCSRRRRGTTTPAWTC